MPPSPRTYTLAELQAIKADFLAQAATIAAVLDAVPVIYSVTEALEAFLDFVEGYPGTPYARAQGLGHQMYYEPQETPHSLPSRGCTTQPPV